MPKKENFRNIVEGFVMVGDREKDLKLDEFEVEVRKDRGNLKISLEQKFQGKFVKVHIRPHCWEDFLNKCKIPCVLVGYYDKRQLSFAQLNGPV